MEWKKSPQDLVDRFLAAAAAFPGAEQKKMFGYPSLFVQGNLAAGLFQDRVMLRLSSPDRERFLKLSGAKVFEPMPGRPMKDYVEAPAAAVQSAAVLGTWLGRCVSYTQTLPPKKKAKGKREKNKGRPRT